MWGGMSPHHPTWGLEASYGKLPQRGPGRKWILGLCIFEVRNKPSKISHKPPFSVFLSDGAPPPKKKTNVAGPGKTPPSRRACCFYHVLCVFVCVCKLLQCNQCSTVVRNTVVRATIKVNGKLPILGTRRAETL